MATRQTSTKRPPGSSGRSNGSAPQALAYAARRTKGPALASGVAMAGLAVGTALGSKLRSHRRPQLLGVPMPRASELKSGAKQAARAGRWVAETQDDVRAVREQAQESRRQSPIEVLLTGLTSRRLPRRGAAAG